MPETLQAESAEEQRGSSERGTEQQAQPLPESLRPSRKTIEPYAIPNPDLYKVAYEGGADLPHHGALHGEETAILAAVLVNVAYQDVLKRRGKDVADAFRGKLDEKVLLLAAAYHDCGRETDWGLHKGEMQKHGPRGADILLEKGGAIDETLRELSDVQMEKMSELVRFHTPTRQETLDRIKDKLHLSNKKSRAARKAERAKNFEDYEPEELMLRILQEADKLGLTRGYYSRKKESPRRTPFAAAASGLRALKSKIPVLRNRPGNSEQGLRFGQSRELGLWKVADSLTRTSRRDPEINGKFQNVLHRSGAAIEAAWKKGILKS